MPVLENPTDGPPTTLRLVPSNAVPEPETGRATPSADELPLPAGTVTFLLTDIEGSTPQWERDPEAMAIAVRRHEQIIGDAVEANGGARPLEQGEGDSVVAAFARASHAVTAALEAQIALNAEPWPAGTDLRVRMAVHTGEAHLQEGRTYAGPDLNRCARLRGLGHGGQVLLSRITHGLMADRPPQDVTFRDLGTYRLRGAELPERVHQLCHPSVPTDFPPLTSTEAQPTNLPNPPSSLVGRSDELADLRNLLGEARVLTLTGSGGCGKSRLALELARTTRQQYPDGVWWIDLAPLADPDLVPIAIASVIGARSDPATAPTAALVNALADQRALIVLDNAEHLLESASDVASTLVTGCPAVRLLVTSREPLGIDGEWTWRVPSLALADDNAAADIIAASEAVQLFVTRASQVRPGFALTDDNAASIAQICRRLDGIPLALELAAARVRVLSPTRIANGLDDRFRLLTGGSRRAMPRQQTLESSVAWSYELLDDHERTAFRRLAPFAGGFTLTAAEYVVAGDDIDEFEVLDLLTRLVDKSLILVDTEREDARYTMLETLRQFAAKALNETGETEERRGRHLEYFLALSAAAEPHLTGLGQQQWLDAIEDDLDNFRAAADWATATKDGAALWLFTGNLSVFNVLHGHFADARLAAERASELNVEDNDAAHLHGLWGDAYASLYGGDYDRGLQSASEAIERARSAGNDRVLARALVSRGTFENFVDPAAARATLSEAIPLARGAGDDWCLADALQMFAYTYLLQGDFEHGVEELSEGRVLAHRMQSQQLIAWDHLAISSKAIRLGPLAEARAEADAAIRAAERSGDPSTYGLALNYVGLIELMQGRGAEMVPLLEERLERIVADGGGISLAPVVGSLAAALVAAGRSVDAQGLLDHYADTFFSPLLQVLNETVATPAALRTGDPDAAEVRAAGMLAQAEALDIRWAEADARHFLGHLALLRGEIGPAEDEAHRALACAATGPYPGGVADALQQLASVAAEQESDLEAARLLGAARSVLDDFGAAITLADALLGVPSSAPLREALGDEAFEAAWNEGLALTMDEAIAYATRARGERKRPSIGWDSLTPTEREVVAFLAQGLTNREIGERMFISAGTVKTHVAHSFAKLGMSRRSEVAAAYARRTEPDG